jgi:hypothetical protein
MLRLHRVIYRLNDRDEICFVNQDYDEFALSNGSPTIISDAVLNQPLWDFIAGDTTRELYREVVKRVRQGNAVQFQFRCDSPDCRRLMQMNVAKCENGEIEFTVDTLNREMRSPTKLLDPNAARSEEFLLVCSWCKKVRSPDGWVEVEEAIRNAHLLEHEILPELTHGICDPCYKTMSELLTESKTPIATPHFDPILDSDCNFVPSRKA